MDLTGRRGWKRVNDCFGQDEQESLPSEENLLHEARRKRIRIGTQTQPSPIAEMWRTAARMNEPRPPALDVVNYSNQIQAALTNMFNEIFNAVNKVQNVLFKISSSTGRSIKTARRVYLIDNKDVEMKEPDQ